MCVVAAVALHRGLWLTLPCLIEQPERNVFIEAALEGLVIDFLGIRHTWEC